LENFIETLKICLKLDKIAGHFTWKPECIYCCWQHKFAIKSFFKTLISIFLSVTCTSTVHNTVLHFHCSSGYMNTLQCHIMHMLPVMLCLVQTLLFSS